jgi:hypothetical protein
VLSRFDVRNSVDCCCLFESFANPRQIKIGRGREGLCVQGVDFRRLHGSRRGRQINFRYVRCKIADLFQGLIDGGRDFGIETIEVRTSHNADARPGRRLGQFLSV